MYFESVLFLAFINEMGHLQSMGFLSELGSNFCHFQIKL